MYIQYYENPVFSHYKMNKAGVTTAVHYHNDHELYYMVDGSTKYLIGDEIFDIHSGDFVFIPKNVLHKTDSENNLYNERILISFTDELFSKKTLPLLDLLSDARIIHIPNNKITQITKLLYLTEEEYNSDLAHSDIMLELYITELLTLLCRFRHDRPASPSNSIIKDISDYISKNYDSVITLSVLSEKFAMSESHMSRTFKAVTGLGISEYITYVRITNAERLLCCGTGVTETAMRCGFNDSNYFATVFKKIKGMTPYRFMKENTV